MHTELEMDQLRLYAEALNIFLMGIISQILALERGLAIK